MALLRREGRWFLQRRDPANPVLPSCWEFPGGKVEEGEMPEAALRRELKEEVGVDLRDLHPGPNFVGQVHLHTFYAEADVAPRTPLAWGWFRTDEILRLPIPPLNVALIQSLASLESEGQAGFALPI